MSCPRCPHLIMKAESLDIIIECRNCGAEWKYNFITKWWDEIKKGKEIRLPSKSALPLSNKEDIGKNSE